MLDSMKISNKEKTMLCVLGSIIVGFLYYQFIYVSQVGQLEQKVKEENEFKQKYKWFKWKLQPPEFRKNNTWKK